MVIHSVLNCELRNSGFLHHLHTSIRTHFNEFSMTSQANKINRVIIFHFHYQIICLFAHLSTCGR